MKEIYVKKETGTGGSVAGTVVCKSCGAEYDASEPGCPYCGTMNLPGAEKAYMNKLEGIRGDLEELGTLGKKEAKVHAGRLGKKILIAAAVLAAAIAVVLIVMARREAAEAARDRAEYLWQRKGFAEMDRLYEAGDYDGLTDYFFRASEEDHDVWQYRHRDFCSFYRDIRLAEESLRVLGGGREDMLVLFHDELNLYALERMIGLSDEERALLEELREPLIRDFGERFKLTEEELDAFLGMIRKDGFVPLAECRRFFKEKGWSEA